MATYDPSTPGPAINEADFANYILATFDSVASLKAALDEGLMVRY